MGLIKLEEINQKEGLTVLSTVKLPVDKITCR